MPSSKPASEAARVSRAPEAGRVDRKDGVVTSHTPHFQVKGSLSFPLVKYLLGVLATIYIHHNYRVGKKVQLKAQIRICLSIMSPGANLGNHC